MKIGRIKSTDKELGPSLEWIIENFIEDATNVKEAIAIYSYPDLINLKSNKEYIEKFSLRDIQRDHNASENLSFPKSIIKLLKKGIFAHQPYVELIDTKGAVTYWDVTIRPLEGESNNKYLIIFLNDVTEIVMEMKALKKQIKDMGTTLKVQEEIFVNISHELKTPLNLIFSASQLLNMNLDTNPIEDIAYCNKIIMRNCYRLTKLINNILDNSKIEPDFNKLNLTNNNIIDTIDNIVSSVSEYFEEKEVEIIFDTELEELIMAFDTCKIERVLLNLISNAIKFSNESCQIAVNLVDKGDSVEISVKDNGIGIEEDNLAIIFEKYKQVTTSLNRISEGAGIGLSLVKSIIELHKGTISVESAIGVGSVFTIELPLVMVNSQNGNLDKNYYENKDQLIKLELSDIY